MVRTTTRRTRTDVESLAAIVSGEGADADRKERLVDHEWARTTDIGAFALTDTGRHIGGVASGLIDRNDFEATVDLMGLPDFVDAALEADPVTAEAFFAGVRTVAAVADEAFGYGDAVSNYPANYDPTPSFTFDGDTVEVAFDDRKHARLFREFADRFDPERKHDERFTGNRNPRRLVVDVDVDT
jgi:hypothetical protein